jgi:dynactin 6
MICENATIKGSVQIGEGSVIHPLCVVSAVDDTCVTLGERNIVEEKCHVQNTSMGHGNLIEVGASIKDSELGSFNRVGPNCKIDGSSKIGDYCVIGPCVVLSGVIIPDKTAVYRSDDGWDSMPVELDTLVCFFNLVCVSSN